MPPGSSLCTTLGQGVDLVVTWLAGSPRANRRPQWRLPSWFIQDTLLGFPLHVGPSCVLQAHGDLHLGYPRVLEASWRQRCPSGCGKVTVRGRLHARRPRKSKKNHVESGRAQDHSIRLVSPMCPAGPPSPALWWPFNSLGRHGSTGSPTSTAQCHTRQLPPSTPPPRAVFRVDCPGAPWHIQSQLHPDSGSTVPGG